ncbi:hypothetical protein R0K18_25355, partial [Pantoea sp. SIMBA_133]
VFLIFTLIPILKFVGVFVNLEFINLLTPYTSLVASLVSYILLLVEIIQSTKRRFDNNRNLTFFSALILGIIFSILVYFSGLNVNYIVNGLSFLVLGITTYLYHKFELA